MNSKTQFRQLAIPRVVTTKEPPGGERGEGGGRGRGGRGRGGRQRGEGEEETTGLNPTVFKALGPVSRRRHKA